MTRYQPDPERLAWIVAETEKTRQIQRCGAQSFCIQQDCMRLSVSSPPPAGTAHDRSFWAYNRQPFVDMLRLLEKRLGFWVQQGRVGSICRRKSRYRRLDDCCAAGARGRLRMKAEYYPSGMKFEFYPDGNRDNPHGPWHATSTAKHEAMDYVTTLRLRQALIHMRAALLARGLVEHRAFSDAGMSPYEAIEWGDRMSGHFGGEASIAVERKRYAMAYQAFDRDGKRMRNGDTKWFYAGWGPGRGHLMRGEVFYDLNGNWWVVAGGRLYRNTTNSEFFDYTPGTPRREQGRRAIASVKSHLAAAVAAENFERAIILRDRLRVLDPPKAPAQAATAAARAA